MSAAPGSAGPAVLAATSTSAGETAAFWVLGSVAVLGALGTVLLRRAVHSALCLAGTMVILALFYLANGAYFLGIVQIVVYTGAVMMLFLFVLMLVGVSTADSLKETLKGQRWLAAACGLGLGILLVAGLGQVSVRSFEGLGQANAGGNVPALASLLFTKYVVAFEVVGALLTVAAVGATLLTHRERIEKTKSQREQAEERVRAGKHLPPLPAPGVYARHNAVDRPGLLPDGTPSDLTVSATLRNRGQVREVGPEALHRVAALEQRTADSHGQTEHTGRMYGEPHDPERDVDDADDEGQGGREARKARGDAREEEAAK
ncbi:NADH:ubiquinone oxidoreductase subunit J [Streptomyces abyssalis]|uniref:NADH-quinone oxidoreductase subunit J n=2 Tax=Streptomyces abyssalis TaxID=933944 RepID=A0A1E7JIC9_9ACTN|nr:NADH:ubiquinone oxidoreductase subunit J [Streptomyces abyssalis]OEU95720.1 NADH:ubiquinone oxidoreductase subunit J [Streptomyces abyssalis]OEV29577.1 NADH:ubiquinone oxidoreductase subunit J [Streptomyces nanshensis]